MKNSPFLDAFEIPPTQEGVLSGLTFAVKDTLDVKGFSPANGVPKWEETHPKATCHASVIDLLLKAGANLLG